jgi:hypothetical protein
MTKYPHAETAAAKMLAQGLRTAAAERKLSLREIGRRLGYSQPVVLSHMATGRVPIPIDRTVEIAEAVGISSDVFLEAVLEQRHPNIDWGLIKGQSNPNLTDLARAIGKPLRNLGAGQLQVIRELVEDRTPEERWISIPEIAAVKLLRELFPNLMTRGLSEDDREALRVAAALRDAEESTADQLTRNQASKNDEC